ncbi:MATE family efflux transporter [Anaerotignum sp. MB30-C6]|uniref:MATE family efflux transporter n=1 Tax=Anaerotignum sp. MB30-C6 TaxID=3070814 RepID=UPI0027DBF6C0|nr:MATE family efflux transporter [Anaerotignum sp. MB30-C6]WMI80023.1 MATE family efflux transporter [Anaerotignum sp. MB30-C6]
MTDTTLDAKEQQKRFILSENLWSVMWQLSWPAVIAMVLYNFNALLDAFFVGRFVGETALAGVSLAYPITQISMAVGSLVGVGAGSVLSIALGSKDKDTQRRILGNINMLTILCTLIYMIIALLFSKQLIGAMGGNGAPLEIGNSYFRITVYGAVFWVYGLAGNMIIRAEGRMKTAAWMMAGGLIANAIMNYIFIVLLDMGVEGAAWGTNIGMLVYSLLGWVYFGTHKASFEAKVASLKTDKENLSSIIRLGMPSLIMSVMSLIQAVVVFNALSRYGTDADIAFYGVVFRIFQFSLTPIFGLMRSLQPVVGINYGAKQYHRVIRSYKIFGVAAMFLTIPFWLASLIAPGPILGSMLTEQTIASTQITYFRIIMVILPVLSFIFMAMTFFPAVGKGKPAAIIGIARQFLFYVPVMLIVPRFFGVAGIYYGSLAIDAIIVVWTLLLVGKEFNLLRRQMS